MQRTIAATKKFVSNNDLNGFPSADLAALTAGLASFGLSKQSPFFALFSSVLALSCAYARVEFVPFHTWPQVLAGIATGVGYSFLAKQFGVIPSGIAMNLGALALYKVLASKTPKPVVANLGYFALFGGAFALLTRSG